MKRKNHIIKGIIALLISQILIKIIGLAYKLYLTNKEGFGDVGNAIYSSGFQIYALLLTFSSIGVPNALSKLVSERFALGDTKGAHKIFKISFFIFAFIGMCGCILLFISAEYISTYFIQIPEAKFSLMALAPSIFFVSITAVFRGYFNGMENLSVTARSQTTEQILKTILTISFVEVVSHVISNDVEIMATVANLATTFATAFGFMHIFLCYCFKKKQIGNEIKQSVNYYKVGIRKNLKKILNVAIPISLSSLISSFNKNIDSFTIVRFLKYLMTEEQAKIQYGILSGKVDMLTVLPLSLNIPFVTALVPEISKANMKGSRKEIIEKSNFFIMISIIIGLPMTVGMFVYAGQILELLFPNAKEGIVLLRVSSISIVFSIIAQTINAILQGIGKEKVPLMSFITGMLVKLICNFVLIKRLGISGAIIGNISCNIIVCLIGFYNLKRNVNFKINIRKCFIKPLVLTAIMIFISICIYNLLVSIIYKKMATIVSILIAIIVYIMGLFILKILPKNIFLIKK